MMNYTHEFVSDHGAFGKHYKITEVTEGEPRIFYVCTLDEAEIPALVEMMLNPPAAPAGLTVADFSRAIQAHLDAKAQERQYDNIHTAIGYRGDPNPVFDAEAEALFAWRSAVWTYATAELAKVQAGERSVPSLEGFIGELPVFEWPSAE